MKDFIFSTSDHPLANKIVTLNTESPHQSLIKGAEALIINWWDRMNPAYQDWRSAYAPIAAVNYQIRQLESCFPPDNEVVYGKIQGRGYLIHSSEISDFPNRRQFDAVLRIKYESAVERCKCEFCKS